MVRPINKKAEEAEKAIQHTIAGIKDRIYKSTDEVAKKL